MASLLARFDKGLFDYFEPAYIPDGGCQSMDNMYAVGGNVRLHGRYGDRVQCTDKHSTPVVYAVGRGSFASQHEGIVMLKNSAGTGVDCWMYNASNDTYVKQSTGSGGNAGPCATTSTFVVQNNSYDKYIYIAENTTSDPATNVVNWYKHTIGTSPSFVAVSNFSGTSPTTAATWNITRPPYSIFSQFKRNPTSGTTSPYTVTEIPDRPSAAISVYCQDDTVNKVTINAGYSGATQPFDIQVVADLAAMGVAPSYEYNDAFRMLIRGAEHLNNGHGTTFTAPYRMLVYKIEYTLHSAPSTYITARINKSTLVDGDQTVWFDIADQTRASRAGADGKIDKIRISLACNGISSSYLTLRYPLKTEIYAWTEGAVWIWDDRGFVPPGQPVRYAYTYKTSGNVESFIGGEVTVPNSTWVTGNELGVYLAVHPTVSAHASMVGGSINVYRRIDDANGNPHYYLMENILNTSGAVATGAIDKYTPAEHITHAEYGLTNVPQVMPSGGIVRAITAHKERLVVAVDNVLWFSTYGKAELHYNAQAPASISGDSPDKHYADNSRTGNVRSLVSGDALFVGTDSGVYLETGWPDRMSQRKIKVYDVGVVSPYAMHTFEGGCAAVTYQGVQAFWPNGEITELTQQTIPNVIQNTSLDGSGYSFVGTSTSLVSYRGELYVVAGTKYLHRTRDGYWWYGTWSLPVFAYMSWNALPKMLGVFNSCDVYKFGDAYTSDNGTAVTWNAWSKDFALAMEQADVNKPIELRALAPTGKTLPTVTVYSPGTPSGEAITFPTGASSMFLPGNIRGEFFSMKLSGGTANELVYIATTFEEGDFGRNHPNMVT